MATLTFVTFSEPVELKFRFDVADAATVPLVLIVLVTAPVLTVPSVNTGAWLAVPPEKNLAYAPYDAAATIAATTATATMRLRR